MRRIAMCGLAALTLCQSAAADPCGMVPPAWIPGETQPVLARQGDQITYVFYKDGVQTMVLRPGFTGSIDEFGMLIPFPSAPALRKTADETFAHIGSSVDAPLAQVQIYEHRYYDMPTSLEMERSRRPSSRAEKSAEAPLRFDEVRVVNQEAVGMYEVAVLEAGSSQALNRWMEDHAFKYPEGMDEVIEDYVGLRWVFVAIKAKVGQMPGVAPRAGMRSVDGKLPDGATFNGHVQGMGFRYRTDEPVVPMRLASFNDATDRNLVYVLADEGVKLRGMSEDLVVRQVSGSDVRKNLTELLPLSVSGGSLTRSEEAQIEGQRVPDPYNKAARELFASDLLAMRTEELSLGFEEDEKKLLAISEALGLRGPQIDALHHANLDAAKSDALEDALTGLDDMVLTVIDGEFDGQLTRTENLMFEPYELRSNRNARAYWTRAAAGPHIQVWR